MKVKWTDIKWDKQSLEIKGRNVTVFLKHTGFKGHLTLSILCYDPSAAL